VKLIYFVNLYILWPLPAARTCEEGLFSNQIEAHAPSDPAGGAVVDLASTKESNTAPLVATDSEPPHSNDTTAVAASADILVSRRKTLNLYASLHRILK
jgi:hypothetical protein